MISKKYPYMFRVLPRLIGPVVLLIILTRINFQNILKTIGGASLFPIIVGYLIFIPSLLCRVIRWKILLLAQRIQISLWDLFSAYAYSCFVGFPTPGRVGEFIKVFYLKGKGYSLSSSFVSVLIDRLLDILILIVIGATTLLTIIFYKAQKLTIGLFLIVSAGIILFCLILWMITRERNHSIVIKNIERWSPKTICDRLVEGYQKFCKGFKQLEAGHMVGALVFTVMSWTLNFLSIYLFSTALGFAIPYFHVVGIASIFTLIVLLPISVMGLGTRDTILIIMLAQYGIDKAGAVAFSTICFSYTIAAIIICSFSLLTPASKIAWRPVNDDY